MIWLLILIYFYCKQCFEINHFYMNITQCCSIAGGFRPTMWVTGFDDRFKWNVWEWGDPSRSRHSRHMCPKCPTIFKATFFFNIITLASQTVVFMPKKGQRFTKLKPNFFRLFINQFFVLSRLKLLSSSRAYPQISK